MHLRVEIFGFKEVYGKLLKISLLIFIKRTEQAGLVKCVPAQSRGLEKGDLQGVFQPKPF